MADDPTCSDFDEQYRDDYADFEWIPEGCMTTASGCYRGVDA